MNTVALFCCERADECAEPRGCPAGRGRRGLVEHQQLARHQQRVRESELLHAERVGVRFSSAAWAQPDPVQRHGYWRISVATVECRSAASKRALLAGQERRERWVLRRALDARQHRVERLRHGRTEHARLAVCRPEQPEQHPHRWSSCLIHRARVSRRPRRADREVDPVDGRLRAESLVSPYFVSIASVKLSARSARPRPDARPAQRQHAPVVGDQHSDERSLAALDRC